LIDKNVFLWYNYFVKSNHVYIKNLTTEASLI